MLQYTRNNGGRSALLLLALLLATDFAFLLLYVAYVFFKGGAAVEYWELLSITKDQSYSELYQYIKMLWIVIILVYIALQTKVSYYFLWGGVYTFFLLDDALTVHEYVGGEFAIMLYPYISTKPLGVKINDVGELIFLAVMGVLLMSIIIWGYSKGGSDFKNVSKDLALLVLVLAFFGFVVDMMRSVFATGRLMKGGLGIVEDMGEMVAISLTLWYVFLIATRKKHSDVYLNTLLSEYTKSD